MRVGKRAGVDAAGGGAAGERFLRDFVSEKREGARLRGEDREKRSPSPPETENTVKGARDAFTETLRTNTSLVRRHLRTPGLRLTETVIGKKDADQGHGLLDRSPDGPGAAAQDAGETFFHRH